MVSWLENISIPKLISSKISKKKVLFFSILFIFLIDLLDYSFGGILHLSIFLTAPAALVTWNVGLPTGLLLSVLSASYPMVDYLLRPHLFPHPWIVIWDATVVSVYFSIICIVLAALKKELENTFEKSRIDPLTGLLNAGTFFEMAEKERSRSNRYGHPFTLCFLDLDNFKKVNDIHGHLTGDKLLKKVSAILRNGVRSSDIVGRLGGDEFVVLFPETGSSAAERLSSQLHQALNEALKNETPLVTASMGVVTFFDVPAKIDEMVHMADLLMYEAKKSGKNLLRCKTVGVPTKTSHHENLEATQEM